MESLKCPKCESKSLTFGLATKTAMYFPAFTDEDGKLHRHDSNTTTEEYTCRKCGHTFTESYQGSCWCGWTGET